MSFSHICIVALLVTGGASSDSCKANDQACLEDEGPDLSELMQRAAAVKKSARNSLSMEQTSIDDMLTQVANMGDQRIDGRLPSDQQKQVAEIKQLLADTVLPGLERRHADAQDELNQMNLAISNCTGASSTLHEAIASGPAALVNSSRVTHSTCRSDQSNKLTVMTTASDALDTALSEVPDDVIQPSTSGADENVIYLEEVEAKLCGLHDSLLLKKNVKDNATTEHDSTKISCDHTQAAFESNYCNWRLQLTEACNRLETCWGAANQTYTTRSRAVEALEATWKTEFTGIKKILCFVDIWMSDDNVTTVNDDKLNECNTDEINTTSMNIIYPSPAPQGQCETEKVVQYPGSDSFATSEYSGHEFATSEDGVADSTTCTPLPCYKEGGNCHA